MIKRKLFAFFPEYEWFCARFFLAIKSQYTKDWLDHDNTRRRYATVTVTGHVVKRGPPRHQ